jgi:MinD-like ATPase involved in chromosome partitioning or flagellar assembly
MSIAVVTAAAGAAWEAAVVSAFGNADDPIVVTRRCVDVVDLLAVVVSGQGSAALVSAALRRFDADAVDRMAAAGVVPVGVVPRGDAAAEAQLRAAGVEFVLPEDADPQVFASVVTEAVAARADSGDRSRTFGDPLNSLSVPLRPPAGSPDVEPRRDGSVIAVWGPAGAPGRTTVAIGIADEAARLGATSLLIDSDVYGGTVAAAVGLLDESPGLAAACRAAGSSRLDAAALAPLCWQLRAGFRVLTGIPFAQRWPEIRPSAIPAVVRAARALADIVIVDCGFSLETDEELSFDSLAPRRNGATLAVLDSADVVLVVGAADPIGVQRLIRGLAELGEAGVPATARVVLNKVRKAAVPGATGDELSAVVERFAGHTPGALLAYDRAALDAAMASGRLLAEAKPSSPLRKGLRALAADLAGLSAPSARHRR